MDVDQPQWVLSRLVGHFPTQSVKPLTASNSVLRWHMSTRKYTCPSCGAPMSRRLTMKTPEAQFDGVRPCSACGLLSLMPYPDPETVASFYAASGNWELLTSDEIRVPITRRVSALITLSARKGGEIFEVGVSYGDFLAAMKSEGWSVRGIEPGKLARQLTLERHDICVEAGMFGPADRIRRPTDVVVAWDVLEHCRHPGAVFDAMAAMVKPGGVLAIAIPHIDGLPARVLRTRWRYRMTPIHLHFFPMSWLRKRAAENGLSLVRVDAFAKVHAWVEALLPRRLGNVFRRQMPAPAAGNSHSTTEVPPATWQTRLRKAIRRAVFSLNQQPAPMAAGDLIDVYFRRSN